MADPWTPGPWAAKMRANGAASKVAAMRVWAPNFTKVASIEERGTETRANARLIACSPELAALVEAMARELPPPVSTVQELDEGTDKPHPLAEQARALLARIRNGGTN